MLADPVYLTTNPDIHLERNRFRCRDPSLSAGNEIKAETKSADKIKQVYKPNIYCFQYGTGMQNQIFQENFGIRQ
jgi:hypothetical protein